MRRSVVRAAVPLAFVVAPGGCGSDEPESASPQAAKPKAADPSTVLRVGVGDAPLRFDKQRYTAKAGSIRIEHMNPRRIGHNVRVQPADKPCCTKFDMGGTDTASDGQTTTATLNLRPGRYTLYCSLGGHWQGGMKAKLDVG